jgi:hypothetical protein
MSRTVSLPAAAFALVCVLTSSHVMAGGLPRLCLPLEGVTADNADACAQRLAKSLGDEVSRLAVRQIDSQWYVLFSYNRDHIRLNDLDTALQGSPCSVSHDKLRLFGEVVLEIDLGKVDPAKVDPAKVDPAKVNPGSVDPGSVDPGKASADKLLADLAAVKHVSVGEKQQKQGLLRVTLTLPQARYFGRETDDFGKKPLRTETFHIEGSAAAAEGVKVGDLPSYDALRSLVQKHQARLTGLRWKCLGCRVLGAVAADARE